MVSNNLADSKRGSKGERTANNSVLGKLDHFQETPMDMNKMILKMITEIGMTRMTLALSKVRMFTKIGKTRLKC